jgi:hypothetical protein
MSLIDFPILYIPDPVKGRPLFAGQIFVGEPDLDPEVGVNQKQLSVIQEDGTKVNVSQPFILSAGGVPVYLGNPVRLDVTGNYSLKILSKLGAQVYFIENVFEGQPVTIQDGPILAITLAEAIANTEAIDGQIVQITDRGDAQFTYLTGQTPNTFNIVAADKATLDLVLRSDKPNGKIFASQWGLGTADDDAGILAMDNYALGRNQTIVIDTDIILPTTTTINSFVEFTVGSLDNTVTLTFKKKVIGQRLNHFTGSGDVVLNGKSRKLFPEWFGVFNEDDGNDGSVSNEPAGKRMMRCLNDSKGFLQMGHGKYFVRDILLDGSNIRMQGQGVGGRTTIQNSLAFDGSTRIGQMFGIYAPHGSLNPVLGNRDWTGTVSTSNITVKYLDINWDDTLPGFTAPDLAMNGLTVLGAKNVKVSSVNVNLNGANRSLYIGAGGEDQKTEDVFVSNFKGFNSHTGCFITEIGVETGRIVRNIQVTKCVFNVYDVASNAGDSRGFSTGLFLHGNTATAAQIETGKVIFKDNVINGGASGVRDSGVGAGGQRFKNTAHIIRNTFNNFKEFGIKSASDNIIIEGNTFDSSLMQTVVDPAAGILLTSDVNGGATGAEITGNIFKNCRLINAGTGSVSTIYIEPEAGAYHVITDNKFLYVDGVTAALDIFFADSTGIRGDVILKGNRFFDTGSANVRGTTVNHQFLFNDMGGNIDIQLFNTQIYGTRSVSPLDTRYYQRGQQILDSSAGAGAGGRLGFVCTLAGRPGTWRDFVG